jgi:hypothetical protein
MFTVIIIFRSLKCVTKKTYVAKYFLKYKIKNISGLKANNFIIFSHSKQVWQLVSVWLFKEKLYLPTKYNKWDKQISHFEVLRSIF